MKAKRHAAILRIIQERVIQTQDELTRELHRAGIEVTQATVSRDIKQLGLVKEPDGGGTYRYCLPRARSNTGIQERLRRAFNDYVVGVDYSGNLVVIKTMPGTAQGVAAAIDRMEWPEVVGTVAGDDAIIVVIRDMQGVEHRNESTVDLVRRLMALKAGG